MATKSIEKNAEMTVERLESSGAGSVIRWAAVSDIGSVRTENEDRFHAEPEAGLFLVSDGMGGHRGGSLAARIVAEDLPVMIETGLSRLRSQRPRQVRRLLRKCITEQARQMSLEAESESGYRGMGATVVITLLWKGRAYVANLGDSRAYRLRRGRLLQVTRDHSVVGELLEAGEIQPAEAVNHSAQGQITRYIGMEETARPHIRSFELRLGDVLALCTDGLTDMVGEPEIARLLGDQAEPETICSKLVEAAKQAGGDDNVTVLIINRQRENNAAQ